MPLDKNNRTHSFLVCGAAYACALVAAAAVCRFAAVPPAYAAFLADLAATVVVFIFSLALDNSSVYDPYWSVAPPGSRSTGHGDGPAWGMRTGDMQSVGPAAQPTGP